MNAIVEIDPENLICVVRPGTIHNDLKAVLAEQQLWYLPGSG